MWGMNRTNIYLEPRQTELLDDLARSEGISRAELIRRFISRGLQETRSLSDDLAAMEETSGTIPEFGMPVRDPSDRDATLEGLWNRS